MDISVSNSQYFDFVRGFQLGFIKSMLIINVIFTYNMFVE